MIRPDLTNHAYDGWKVEKTDVEAYTRGSRHLVECEAQCRWLARVWHERGVGRVVLVRLVSRGGVWVCSSREQCGPWWEWQARRARSRHSYGTIMYQVNTQTGRWTMTRSSWVQPGGVAEVLGVEDKLTRKAQAWVVAKRLTRGA